MDSSQGEVEVCYNQEWRFVCDDYWTDREAEVVCKSLGFPPEGIVPSGGGAGGGNDENFVLRLKGDHSLSFQI